jgi:hypothetical protein
VWRSLSQSILAFFGLTSEIASQFRFNLFKQIHEIVFHGKGGYTWETIYNMPIWLRKFTFHQIHSFYKEEQEQYQNVQNGNKTTVVDSSGKVNTPEFAQASKKYTSTTYSTKASKK